jgi:hypothetical protein
MQQNNVAAQNSGVYIPPHMNSNQSAQGLRNGTPDNTRLDKDDMLHIYQHMRDTNRLDRNLAQAFQGNWDLSQKNGATSTAFRGDAKDQYPGPDVCWEPKPQTAPLGLRGMDEEERQVQYCSLGLWNAN